MNKIFLGIKGHVVCLDKSTGKEIWRTKLKSDWGKITNVYCDSEQVYVYVHGHVYCLDPKNGSIKWENELKGLGHAFCIIASDSQTSTQIATGSQQAASMGKSASEAVIEVSGGS